MPRISPIELLEYPGTPTLFCRATVPATGLPALIGQGFARVEARLQALGALPSQVPYVLFHNEDAQAMDVEIGCMVAGPLPGDEEVRAGALPRQRVASCLYQGPNEEMGPVYEELLAWIGEQLLQTTGQVLEQYYNGPDIAPELLLTKISLPLK